MDVDSGTLIRTFGGHHDYVNSVAFNPMLPYSKRKQGFIIKLWDINMTQRFKL